MSLKLTWTDEKIWRTADALHPTTEDIGEFGKMIRDTTAREVTEAAAKLCEAKAETRHLHIAKNSYRRAAAAIREMMR